jgi:hypothetical protein
MMLCPVSETATSRQSSSSPNSTPWIIAAVASAALLVQNVETLHQAWRDYVGWFCTFDVESEPVTAYSVGRDVPYYKNPECHEHSYVVRIAPTKRPRKLDLDSLKFRPIEITGRNDNGLVPTDPKLPKGDNAPEVGWYVQSKSPELIEAVVFSRTGACESKRSITGKFAATEHSLFGW